jgi:hypothetical protein
MPPNGHPVDACTALIGFHPSQCFLQVFSVTYFLHQSSCSSWTFGCIHRLWRFSLFPACSPGFTRWQNREVQFDLNILLHIAPEIHVLLASPLVRAFNHRFRLGLSIDSVFRPWSASLALPTTWPTMPSADFCPAIRLPRDSLSRRSDTEQISRGKFNRLLRTIAESTRRIFDGYGLRGKSPARPTLTPCIRFLFIDSRICSTLLSDPASRR